MRICLATPLRRASHTCPVLKLGHQQAADCVHKERPAAHSKLQMKSSARPMTAWQPVADALCAYIAMSGYRDVSIA